MVMTTAAALGAGAASAGSGSLLGTLGLAAVPGLVSGVVNGLFGWKANKDNLEQAEGLNSKNLAFQREQFEYQKYLNQNQYQMMAQDAAKAGINPLAMSGGNVSSSSFSGSSAQGNQTPINVGDLGSFLSPVLNYKLGMQQQRLDEKRTNLELQLGYEQLHEQRRNNNMIDKLQRDLDKSATRRDLGNRIKDMVIAAASLAETKRKNTADINLGKDTLAETIRNNKAVNDIAFDQNSLAQWLAGYQAPILLNQAQLSEQQIYSQYFNNWYAQKNGLPVGQFYSAPLLQAIASDSNSPNFMASLLSALFKIPSGMPSAPSAPTPSKTNSVVSGKDKYDFSNAIKNYIEARKKKGGKK